MKRKQKIIVFLIVTVTLLLISVLYPPPKLSVEEVERFPRASNLGEIATLILNYQSAHHGQRPSLPSDLVPENDSVFRKLFQRPGKNHGFWKPIGWEHENSSFDMYSDYIINPNPCSKILVFERPGSLYPKSSIGVCLMDLDIPSAANTQMDDNVISSMGNQKKILQTKFYDAKDFVRLFPLNSQ